MKNWLIIFFYSTLLGCQENTPQNELDKVEAEQSFEVYKTDRLKEISLKIASEAKQGMADAPVQVLSCEIKYASVNYELKNNSGKEADGVKVTFFFFNNFNEPVGDKVGMLTANRLTAIDQTTIKVNGVSKGSVGFENFSGATKVIAAIQEIHFTDGSSWENVALK